MRPSVLRLTHALPLLIALLVLASSNHRAHAQAEPANLDLAAEADLQFELGVERYRAGEFRAALEHLLASNRLVANRNVIFNVARCYEQLGRFDDAYRHYADFFAQETAPTERDEAKRALSRIEPKVALLVISSKPAGARIYVDRKDLGARGVTPATLAVSPGAHTVMLELDGHEGATSEPMPAETGQRAQVVLTLDRILGTLSVTGEPAGAEIRVDATDAPVAGRLPAELELAPGPHTLFLTAPGRRAVQLVVNVEPRKRATVLGMLPAQTGALVVDADEAGALIEIDGAAAGFAPTVLDSVPTGRHVVRVSRAGFRPYEVTVDLETDARVAVNAALRPVYEVTAASRSAESIDDAPASVTLIGRDELRAFGDETLYEALAATRGVFQTDDQTYQSIGFRGFSRPGDYGNHVLVQLDGHTMNDDLLGSSYVGRDLLTDLGDVERIEVVRGPGSALYGSNAFFGVVNVVTRGAGEVPQPHVGVAAAGDATSRVRVGGGHAFTPRVGFRASVSAARGDGDDVYLEPFEGSPEAPDGEVRGADGFSSMTAQARGWAGPFTLQLSHNRREKRIPTGAFETLVGDPRAQSDDTRRFAELRFEPELNDSLRLAARASVDQYTFEGRYPYDDPSTGVQRDSWSGLWATGEVRLRMQLAKPFALTVGGEARTEFVADLKTENDAGVALDESAKAKVFSGYGVADYAPIRRLSFSFGARFDHFETVGNAFSPRLATLIRPTDDGVLKLIAGQAFRAPSPYEQRYADGTSQVRAETLEPETVRTLEAEYTHHLSADWSLTGDVFFNQIADLISLETTEGAAFGEDALQYVNLDDKASTLGAEVELRRDWRQGGMVSASYAWQRTRLGDFDLGHPTDISNSPEHLIGVKHAVPLGRTGATVANRLRAETRRRTEAGDYTRAAFLWDATLTGDVPQAHLSYGLGVRNLFDQRVDHPVSAELSPLDTVPQAGRTFYATLTVAY